MSSTTTEDKNGPRKNKTAKRRVKEAGPIIDEETGEVIEMDQDSSSDGDADYMDNQEVVDENEEAQEWEDDKAQANKMKKSKKDKRVAKEPEMDYGDEEENENEEADQVNDLPKQIWND